MRALRATFLTSATSAAGYPPVAQPEIAFAGRSNVGKSSLINTLVGVSGLAKTSRTPGRTRMLNWFNVTSKTGAELAFVDLPGYGYAKVSRDMREAWRPLVEQYLSARPVLRAAVCLIDARRGVQAEERELAAWLAETNVAMIAVLTKCDKLPKSKRKLVQAKAGKDLAPCRRPILFSAPSGEGVSELWKAILNYV